MTVYKKLISMNINLFFILILTFSYSENSINSEDNKVISKTNDTENGFYATVRVLDRNGNERGSYIFNAPDSSGTLGGIVNMLSFSAEQIHSSTKNKDYISFSMIFTNSGINLNEIPADKNIEIFILAIHEHAGPELREFLDMVRELLHDFGKIPLGIGLKTLIHGNIMPEKAKGKAWGIIKMIETFPQP